MREFFFKILDNFLDLIFPQSEIILNLEEMGERGELRNLPPATQTSDNFIFSLFSYSDRRVRSLVWAIKYKARAPLIAYVGELIYEEITSELGENFLFSTEKRKFLVPIPMSKKRIRERGFNQTNLIADAIKKQDKENALELDDILEKTKETKPQASLPRSKRMLNLQNSFTVKNPEKIKGNLVILIDDVATTGSTLREARKVLTAAGAKKVLAWTIAH